MEMQALGLCIDLPIPLLPAIPASLAAALAPTAATSRLAGDRLLAMQPSMFSVVDELGRPISSGVFVTDAGVALVVVPRMQRLLSTAGSLVRAVMLQCSGRAGTAGATCEEVMLLFRVHAILATHQCACLVPVTPLLAGTFKPLPLADAPSAGAGPLMEGDVQRGHPPLMEGGGHPPLMEGDVAFLPANAAYNARWHLHPRTYDHHSCRIVAASADSLVYHAEPAGLGEWGGALLVTADGLNAMHERCDDDAGDDYDAATPDSFAMRVDHPAVRAAVEAADAVARAAAAAAEGGVGAAVV